MNDEFMRRAIKTHADSLFPEVREKCKARAKAEHMSLTEQLEMLTAEAMVGYQEPEFLKEKPKDPIPPKRVAPQKRRYRDGKAAAAGEES